MRTMKAMARHLQNLQVELSNGRGHKILVDLPPAKQGNDEGPSSLELVLMSLSGCVGQIFALFSLQHGFNYSNFICQLDAEEGQGAVPFKGIKGVVELETAEPEKAQKILKMTLNACPVGKIFKSASIPFDIELKVKSTISPLLRE